jgi:Fe-S-cluster-containing dehydrogenase component/CheY-like chemotaxis protein
MVSLAKSRILIVEDEQDMRDGLKRIFSRRGYGVDTAEDGLKAVKKIKHKSYQVIIVDLKMPGMDGIAVLQKVKGIDRSIAAIIITGYGTVTSAVESMRLGAFDYITKPFRPHDLTLAVERALKPESVLSEKGTCESILPDIRQKPRQIITVAINKCYACLACVVDCAYARLSLPKNVLLRQTLPVSSVFVKAAGNFAVPLPCMQCKDTPCITVCPTAALYRRSLDEPVLIDKDLCIGCKSCVLACPFGTISLDSEGRAVQKCDMCITRLAKDKLPVCVTSCPMGAIQLATFNETEKITEPPTG